MGSKESKESKINPLRIPRVVFRGSERTIHIRGNTPVVFFSVLHHPTVSTCCFINIINKEGKIVMTYRGELIPGFEEGYYFYIKRHGYVKLGDDKQLEETFQAYNIEIPETIYVHEIKKVPILHRKPKLPSQV